MGFATSGAAKRDILESSPTITAGTAAADSRRPKASLAPAEAPRRTRTRWAGLLAFALLAWYATAAWTAALEKGQSFDEGLQLATGYNLWINDDYRIEGGNGDLIKRWATLPYLISQPHFPGHDDPLWQQGAAYETAYRFFFESGNRPESLLQQGRAMAALLGVATGWLVYGWARGLFGATGGLLALAVFSFSPNMLALGGVVSTDMSITLTMFAATWCIWRLLHEVTWRWLLASLVTIGLLVLAKPTALVILPVTAVLVAVRLAGGRALRLCWRKRVWSVEGIPRQLGIVLALTALHAFAGWGALWAHYGFRYAASPEPSNPALTPSAPVGHDRVPPSCGRLLTWSEEIELLPEGFTKGIRNLLGNDDELGSFMRGEWKMGGRLAFFPYTIWVKTQPSLFALLLAGAGVWAWARWQRMRDLKHDADGEMMLKGASFYELVPHGTLVACYLGIAIFEDLNIGHRHVLPIYPSLYVLTGALALAWPKRKWLVLGLASSMVTWRAVDAASVRPHYLAYFGPQAGGAAHGYQHLVDSSLDWGMNLPGLRHWLDEHDPERRVPLFLAYFGTDSPSYHGIRATRLPGFFDRRPISFYRLRPGYYAISATLLQSVYSAAAGPWTPAYENAYQEARAVVQLYEHAIGDRTKMAKLIAKLGEADLVAAIDAHDALRFGRLCAWLRYQGEPPSHVGHAIFIWRLTESDLNAAINGPPAELTDQPPPAKRYTRYRTIRD